MIDSIENSVFINIFFLKKKLIFVIFFSNQFLFFLKKCSRCPIEMQVDKFLSGWNLMAKMPLMLQLACRIWFCNWNKFPLLVLVSCTLIYWKFNFMNLIWMLELNLHTNFNLDFQGSCYPGIWVRGIIPYIKATEGYDPYYKLIVCF